MKYAVVMREGRDEVIVSMHRTKMVAEVKAEDRNGGVPWGRFSVLDLAHYEFVDLFGRKVARPEESRVMIDLKELGQAIDAYMKELDQEEKLEAAYEASLQMDTGYAEADEFDHAKRVEFYARSIAKLAEGLLAKRPATALDAIEWSAKVIAHTRALCGEWTQVQRGENISAAWDASAEIYADMLDGEEFDLCK